MPIELDPEQTADLQPSPQGDLRNGSWISPFDIPERAYIDEGAFASVAALRFEYPGGETGNHFVSLDEKAEPGILANFARFSGKILELRFDKPIGPSDFPLIAERIYAKADTLKKQSQIYNFIMVARILEHWTDITRKATK